MKLEWLKKLRSETQFFREGTGPTLGIVNQILDELGRPERSFKWRVIVGGTAGKGTVCRRVEDVLEREGVKTACLMSPHLQVVNERIRIGGRLISDAKFEAALKVVKEISERLGIQPTYYEALVLTGIVAAKKAGVEVLIGEIGMGGRLDAVNAVEGKRISVLTFVGKDHLEFFDHDVDVLRREKMGIFNEWSVLNLTGDRGNTSVGTQNLSSNGTNIEFCTGLKQKQNKKLARRVCEKILGRGDFEMRNIIIPARWEKVNIDGRKQLILEGAHSVDRFDYVLPRVKKLKGDFVFVGGMTKNHDPEGLEEIVKRAKEVIWTKVEGDRKFWNPLDLQKRFGCGLSCDDPLEALKKAQIAGDRVLVLGSFYLCGVIRELFFLSDRMVDRGSEFCT